MGTPWDSDIAAMVASEVPIAIATHSSAVNPHNLTPGTIGAATAAHAHDAAYAAAVHTHAVPTGGAIRKTANQTMTATAQTAVADMAFAVDVNSTYVFQMHVSVTTSTGTAPTTNWSFTGPANTSAIGIVYEIDTSTSIEVNGVLTAFAAVGAQAQVANTGAKFHGVIVTGATAGTVQLLAARGGTTPSMVAAAGSNGFWLKVA